jgi:aspartyl/glutamyl-tRNA(Asn/Gln) amidotransferase C subunit
MKELKNIFKLSKLNYTEDNNLLNDVNNILKWVNAINEIDLDGKDKQNSYQFMNLREDIVRDSKKAEKIYESMPEKKEGFCIVPKVIKNG